MHVFISESTDSEKGGPQIQFRFHTGNDITDDYFLPKGVYENCTVATDFKNKFAGENTFAVLFTPYGDTRPVQLVKISYKESVRKEVGKYPNNKMIGIIPDSAVKTVAPYSHPNEEFKHCSIVSTTQIILFTLLHFRIFDHDLN